MPPPSRFAIRSTWFALLLLACLAWPGGLRALRDAEAAGGNPAIRPVELHPGVTAILYLPKGSLGGDPPPLVILLGDSGGQDGRLALYTIRLLSVGFAVLDADFAESALHDGGGVAPELVPLPERLPAALRALRDAPAAVDLDRVSALGIGEGARAILLAPRASWQALAGAVLVYPGCDEPIRRMTAELAPVEGPQGLPIVLAHGDLDAAEAADCAELAEILGGLSGGVARLVVHGAGFGWDAEHGVGRIMLPDPADPDRPREAQPDPWRTLAAMDRMVDFLMRAIGPGGVEVTRWATPR